LLFRILFAGLLLAALTSTPAAALDSKRIYQLNEDRVFQIRVLNRETGKKSSIGSGFIVGDGRQIATNYHVISQVILEPEVFYISYTGKDGQAGELKLTWCATLRC
jgi:S1-C subfamily serine protease